MRRVCPRGIRFICRHEKLRLKPYDDRTSKTIVSRAQALGKATIGYGHVILPEEDDLFAGIDVAKAESLLRSDLEPIERSLARLEMEMGSGLSDYEHAAIAAFILNIGLHAFLHAGAGGLASGVRKALRAGDFERVRQELKRWVYDDGKKVPGLVNRRAAEIALWDGDWLA